jgi:hypothetical protein
MVTSMHLIMQCLDSSLLKHETWKLTNFMRQSRYWEADSFSASQEIARIKWNPVYNSPAHFSCPKYD